MLEVDRSTDQNLDLEPPMKALDLSHSIILSVTSLSISCVSNLYYVDQAHIHNFLERNKGEVKDVIYIISKKTDYELTRFCML